MKTTLLIIFLTFALSIQSQTTTNKGLIASCCETKVGKCTGSASCKVCKNCVRCQHCSNGGTCGVCADTTIKTFTPSKEKKNTKTKKVENQFPVGKTVIVTNPTLNLRKGPGTHHKIIERLSKNDKLFLIEEKEDWVKVLVNDSQKTGWVMYKYVK